MRRWSRELRELIVRALAGLGLVLALAVLGAVLVSTAVAADKTDSGDTSVALAPGGGVGERGTAKQTSPEDLPTDSGSGQTDPSQGGVLLGVVLLSGGVAVLGWGARRPKGESAAQRRHHAEPDKRSDAPPSAVRQSRTLTGV